MWINLWGWSYQPCNQSEEESYSYWKFVTKDGKINMEIKIHRGQTKTFDMYNLQASENKDERY